MKIDKNWIYILIVFIILFVVSLDSYLVFHAITELFTIIVASIIFVIILNTRKYFKNQYMIVFGISYLFIAVLDLFHTLTYAGMPIYSNLNYPANQLWIAARYYESIVLLISFSYFYGKQVNIKRIFIINIVVTTALLAAILWLEIFPDCFIDGYGQTTFKVVSEYIISAILLATLYIIFRRRNDFSKTQYIYLNLALVSTIISELLFTFYISNFGISNLFGHYFKVLSFLFIYQLIIKEGLQDPFSLIFKELEQSRKKLEVASITDPLTGLRNRRSLITELSKVWRQSRRYNKPVTIMMIDIDDFKLYNDKFGHVKGDKILIDISKCLKDVIYRPLDIVSRYGGDEIVIELYDCDEDMAVMKTKQIHKSISQLNHFIDKENTIPLTVSIGYISIKKVETLDFDEIINLVDEELYKAKEEGKNVTSGRSLEENE